MTANELFNRMIGATGSEGNRVMTYRKARLIACAFHLDWQGGSVKFHHLSALGVAYRDADSEEIPTADLLVCWERFHDDLCNPSAFVAASDSIRNAMAFARNRRRTPGIADILHCTMGDMKRRDIGAHGDYYLNLCGGCPTCDSTGYVLAENGRRGDMSPCPACKDPLATLDVGGTAWKMASDIYDNHDFEPLKLCMLADELEYAGCTGSALGHLRSPERHVRGCWAVDLILGRW